MAYGYDSLNRVVCAEEGAANFNDPCASAGRRLASIAYDAQSRRQSVSFANGSTALFGYSARGDIRCHDINLTGAAASACNGAGAEVAYDFTSNGVGQILSESLTSTLSGEDLVWRPSFSANDNYAVNGLNQYTSVTGVSLGYDGNGNLTSDGQGRSFSFDAENVLRTATVSGTGTTDYRYYADGTRAEKIAPGNLTSQFYYMGGLGYLDAGDTEFAANQEIAEYDGATLLRRYVRLPGSVDEAFLMIDQSLPAGDRERWAHPNRLGSTVLISDSTGAVVDTHTYSPFGQAGEGDGGFPFRFTGQKLDPETGLYYYKARYYDPELGRFLQTDPIGYADQMNLYAYVGNDPINATDPTGMCGTRIKDGNGDNRVTAACKGILKYVTDDENGGGSNSDESNRLYVDYAEGWRPNCHTRSRGAELFCEAGHDVGAIYAEYQLGEPGVPQLVGSSFQTSAELLARGFKYTAREVAREVSEMALMELLVPEGVATISMRTGAGLPERNAFGMPRYSNNAAYTIPFPDRRNWYGVWIMPGSGTTLIQNDFIGANRLNVRYTFYPARAENTPRPCEWGSIC